ncbi:type IV pilus twitching motility protein PilT [Meiothermus granaticius]|uniref:Twitching mobility protein n=1 Tax=Meiothermus granaticius NBRC 107808 TaxID=1227551 RepID=A0A399FAB6_9DEIN|nr:PilT/PilU family type 4a pilus ATPase [Meiothermus granaticius]MCL6525249.1 PilT/PilU family type 4a pilus ATPase [Thermaceae bacterium]RIH92636.1 Twitching mobility protein [Meiothermus granaticius NBRC 107808]GEM87598.1 twitching motility protein PilT [Meiothermus granaticius NBRC 107808]
MNFSELLSHLLQKGASEVHFHAGMPVLARIGGQLQSVGGRKLKPTSTAALVQQLCSPQQKARLEVYRQVDLAYSLPGVSRLRANVFYQRGSASVVFQVIGPQEASLQQVNLPEKYLHHFRDLDRGLLLVVGPRGAGKSTTLARLVDEINTTQAKLILTIEDPIEYLHKSKRSAVVQREIGSDAVSFEAALMGAQRQRPDVIAIGEIRDVSTASAALNAAQNGHLVLSTLVAPDSARAIHTLLKLFPPEERMAQRIVLAESLVGLIAQRLIPSTAGERVAVMEVVLMGPALREVLKHPESNGRFQELLHDPSLADCQSFDAHLLELYRSGQVDYQTALLNTTDPAHFEAEASHPL